MFFGAGIIGWEVRCRFMEL